MQQLDMSLLNSRRIPAFYDDRANESAAALSPLGLISFHALALSELSVRTPECRSRHSDPPDEGYQMHIWVSGICTGQCN